MIIFRTSLGSPVPATVTSIVLVTSPLLGCMAPLRSGRPLSLVGLWEAAADDHKPQSGSPTIPTPFAETMQPHIAARDNRPADGATIGQDHKTPPGSNKRWHVDVVFRDSYVKLASTKRQLDRRLDGPLRLDILPVFDRPYTPIDRKTDLGLTSWYVGVGRQENTSFLWTYYVGGGAGKDLNHQRFLLQTLEVDFKYVYAYTGVTAEYYPWEVPPEPSSCSWEARLRAVRPYLLAGIESGYVSAAGEGDYKLAGRVLYHDEQKIRDWLFSGMVGVGWAVPLDSRWTLNLTGDYRFHFYRPDEYNGWNFSAGIRCWF